MNRKISMKPKTCGLKRQKIDNSPVSLRKKRRHKLLISEIKEMTYLHIDLMDIIKIITEYY